MRKTARLLGSAFLTTMWCAAPLWAQQPSLVPLEDPNVTEPLTPAGVSRETPECFGLYVQLWQLDDGTEVIQYYGDFSLHLGDRRMRARDAVIWMQRRKWQDTAYYHYEVYLSDNAEVRESAGTITRGTVLFVTFNTMDSPVLSRDADSREPGADTPLYLEAAEVRKAIRLAGESAVTEMRVVEPGQRRTTTPATARPIVRHSADEERFDAERNLITSIGHVYVSQGAIDSSTFLEIRADAAVLFVAIDESAETDAPPPPTTAPAPEGVPFPEEFPEERPEAPRDTMGFGESVGGPITGAYLTGDVILTRGDRMIRATELYYDFETNRAFMLDAVMRAMVPDTNLPVYVRAEQVRQLSQTEYSVRDAKLSTSEFHTPHIYLGAEKLKLTDATPRSTSGAISDITAGRFEVYNATINVEDIPVAYWPYGAGDFKRTETALRSVRTAYSDDFGATAQAKWYMFNLLGLEQPEGMESILRTDYFGDRGPGIGNDTDYISENAFGLTRTYYIHDEGVDNLGPFRTAEPEKQDRGRATWRHKQILDDGWELTLEASYISDPTFLEEYFNAEFEEGKEQETLAYLKKQQDNWAFTTQAQWRVNDFLSQTERLPDFGFHWIGEPVGDIASYYNETHAGFVRQRPDDRRLFNENRYIDNTGASDIVARAETRNEFDFPIKLDNLNVMPYVTGRYGHWDDSPFASSMDRTLGSVGVKTGTQFWKLDRDVQSELLDLNGIRHIVKPEATVWYSESNRDSFQLYPFDEGVETVDDFYGSSFALRQRWQTKRGGPGRWKVVDWITFDLEANFFGDAPPDLADIGRFYESRPENSVARNHILADGSYRISDTTVLLADANIDLNDGTLDIGNVSYAVERTPRFAYFLGYRRIGDTDSNLLGGGFNYRVNVKHTVGVRAYFDLERGEAETFDLTVIRKFPRWYGAVVFAVDNIEEDFSVGFSAWPEGAPQAAIGTRKYTGLATSTGIRPEE